jgi:transposase InsO family protein
MIGQFSASALFRMMEVSRSGYYEWRDRPPSVRAKREMELVAAIKGVHAQSAKHQYYGSPRVHAELGAQGLVCGVKRVARLMRKHGIAAKRRRRFRHTTIVNPMDKWFEDVVNRHFVPDRPNTVWASDITYLWTREGWMYLATVMDLHSRRIVGWAAREYMTKELVVEAMTAAIQMRRPQAGLIHHSDRGTQYASADYRKLLDSHGIVGSMSEKGDCWDNACAESFFSTLKKEMDDLSKMTRTQAWQTVFEFIEIWYNRLRRHSTLGYASPAQYEGNIVQASKS